MRCVICVKISVDGQKDYGYSIDLHLKVNNVIHLRNEIYLGYF